MAHDVTPVTDPSPAMTPVPSHAHVERHDRHQERDLWWGGYAGRTLTPSFLVCGGLTLLIIMGASVLQAWLEWQGDVVRYVVYGLLGTLWLTQVSRWLRRLFSHAYRLTTRRLFCDRGFFFPSTRAIDLTHIERVIVDQDFWSHWLNVGTLRLVLNDRAQPLRLMEGVLRPTAVADMIEHAALRARERQAEAAKPEAKS
ncbi:MAG: PH domain-containing protein [Gemmataceae bacterium]